MRKHYIISYLGEDKPGLVDQLSRIVHAVGGNWLASRSMNLGGIFCGIVQISLQADQSETLVAQLDGLRPKLLNLTLTEQALIQGRPLKHIQMRIIGADRPGIVAEVCAILAQLEANIEEMETAAEPAPMSSDLTFQIDLTLSYPASLTADHICQSLEQLSDDLMVETLSAL